MLKTIDVIDIHKYGIYNIQFELIPLAWKGFKLFHYVCQGWSDIKYLNDSCDGFNEQIDTIPSDKGGIYVFYIKGSILSDIHNYIVYIGRAQHTKNQNLKKRCKEYWQKFFNKTEPRIKIDKMMNLYGEQLYIKFLPLDLDNEIIKELEKELVKAIRPPFNDDIPKITYSEPVNAF
jgi:hypothetical protein